MRRGALCFPAKIEKHDDGRGFKATEFIGRRELNYYCLYWDELVIPDNSLISIGIDGEGDFINAGFLRRPRVNYADYAGRDSNYDHMIYVQQKVAQELKKEKRSTHWFMGHIGSDIDVYDGVSTPSLIIEFTRALPVPVSNVHVDDILKFKEHRRDEIDAVHEFINELYIEVRKSSNPNLEEARSFNRIESALRDLNKSFFEKWKELRLFDLSVNKELNGSDIYSAFLGLQAAYLATQNQIAPAILHGATAALPSVLSRISFKSIREKDTDRSKLKYIAKASDVGIVKLI